MLCPPLQVEELLKEVRVSEKKKDRIDAFLREINQRLMKVPSVPETEVKPVAWPGGLLCELPKWGPCIFLQA